MTDLDITSNVIELTSLLRTSQEPRWERTRQLLLERGVSPATTYLVEFYSEDSFLEYHVIVTDRREVYEFDFDTLHRPDHEGLLTSWRQIGERWDTHSNGQEIAVAMRLLEESVTSPT